MDTTLVLMAAGFGSRFSGGVKQLQPVGPNGEVLMEYAVHDALAAGFSRVIFIIRRDLEKDFRESVGRRVEQKCAVEYAFQDLQDLPAGFALPEGRVKPWGTGQAVLACRDKIRGPFCVLNADDYYGPEAFLRIHEYISAPERDGTLELCMAGYKLGNTLSESGAVTRGLCRVGEDGRLLAIRETRGIVLRDGQPCMETEDGLKALDADVPVSMNIWGMPAAFIDYLQEGFGPFLAGMGENRLQAEYLLPTVVGGMVESGRGRVQVLKTRDRWFGMTYMQDKIRTRALIRELIDQGAYPGRL